MKSSSRDRLQWLVLPVVLLVAASVPGPAADQAPVRVEIGTNLGSFTLELYPSDAPLTVRRFLRMLDDYEGSRACEIRAHGYLVFGCEPPAHPGAKPDPLPGAPPVLAEIDAEAMGLDELILEDPARIEWLWQRELVPRYRTLKGRGEPVPAGLKRLVETVRDEGADVAPGLLRGKSWQWYLEAVGFTFTRGASARPLERGAIATASVWPGESDARFLVALTSMPEREGRATVFGRVVDGWNALDAMASAPIDKSHVPVVRVVIESATLEPGAD